MTVLDKDIWFLIIAHTPATIAAIAALVGSLHNRKQISTLHFAVNSRLSELLAITRAVARAEGVEAERLRREVLPPETPAKQP
jgi:hypothetical protein